MNWLFKRRRPKRDPITRPSRAVFDTDGIPVIVPVEGADYEEVIVALLERAKERAKETEVGESFTVLLTDDEWTRCIHPSHIVAPVFMRAPEYGLMPDEAFNEAFTFYKE